jgi:predicted permease
MDTLLQDLRHAARKLRKSPGFALVAVLTLALGIGANSAIFSVVNAVLLRPLPMKDSEQLVRAFSVGKRGNMSMSGLDFLDFRQQSASFTGMAAVDTNEASLTGDGGEPERLQGAQVTAEFFSLIGVTPQLGRAFTEGEDQPGKSQVVVLGNALWKRRFNSDAGVLGKSITIGGRPYTVVGVARPEFDFPDRAQLWTPLTWEGDLINPENRGAHFLDVYGRLKPGVTPQQAAADLAAIAKRLEAQYPQTNTGFSATTVPLRDVLVGKVRPALLMLMGAVALVLLIACANLSNLLLARAVDREGEMSVRLAMGAQRGHIIRQLLTESALLALLGGTLGILLGRWALDGLVAFGPRDIPGLEKVAMDGAVLAFSAGLTLLTALLFGLYPALQASRAELSSSLREIGKGGGTGNRGRARNALIVAEAALAVVLLVGAGLLLRSFVRLQQVDPGFKPENVLTVQLALPEGSYEWGGTATGTFYDTLLERLRTQPGVQAVGATFALPLTGRNMISTIRDTARPAPEPGQESLSQVAVVTPGYLEAMRIRLVKGRLLSEQDGREGTKGVVISEETARRYWPGEDPVGKRVEIGIDFGAGQFGGEVVGVVADVRHEGMAADLFPSTYVPFHQGRANNMLVVLRTAGDPLALVAAVREEVRALNKDVPVGNVRTLEAIVGSAVAQPRFYLLLVGLFAVVALVLAALGIYGVVANAVGHRTRELGIRMALGAEPGSLMRMVLGQSMRMTALGLALGVVLAFGAAQALGSLLYTVKATDPLTYAGVAGLLCLVALVASFLPARRATRIDPVIALKGE